MRSRRSGIFRSPALFASVFGALVACGGPSAEPVATTSEALTGPNVWVAGSMNRVGRNDMPGSTSDALIHAARGEYESFQLVVQAPAAGLTHANVTVTDLAGPGGATLAASNVALFREQYTTVTSSSPDWGGSNRPLGAGEYPDGLIPFVDPSTGKSLYGGTASIVAAPFTVAAGQNQPIWVDVYVPPGSRAGAYAGTYSVSSDQGTFSGKVTVDVWAFTLPAKPALKSSFLFWNSVPQAAHEEMLRNKLDPLSVPASEQGALMSQFGLQSDGLPFFSGADVSNCTMSPAPSVASIQASAAMQAKGLYLYAYSADEIGNCTSLYPTVQAWGLALHQAGVDNLVTMAPVQQLFDDGSGKGRSAVDDWTVLPVEYVDSIATIKQALAKGDHVWSYNTLVQDAYSPKWEIDFHPLDFRIQPGFLSATQSLTGILYWRVDQWSTDPWMNVNNAGTYSSSNYPGEAQLLYPGQDVGIAGAAPSMRLKWLRDGVEDYDYVALLQRPTGRAGRARRRRSRRFARHSATRSTRWGCKEGRATAAAAVRETAVARLRVAPTRESEPCRWTVGRKRPRPVLSRAPRPRAARAQPWGRDPTTRVRSRRGSSPSGSSRRGWCEAPGGGLGVGGCYADRMPLALRPTMAVSPVRRRIALAIAALADAVQLGLFPVFAEGALSIPDDALDAVVAALLLLTLGWNWRLCVALGAELVPGLDLFPTWTAFVLMIRSEAPVANAAPQTRSLSS